MSTHLDAILATTRTAVTANKSRVPVDELENQAMQHQPRGWAKTLRKQSARQPAIIAELKKASPSKGLIRADFDVAWLAERYAAGGAAVLSVLTDEPYFQGSLRNLELASAAVPLPCLRKDFTVDEYQIVEARSIGADVILLIAACLTPAEVRRLAVFARGLGLEVLLEIHNEEELAHICEETELVGVNNRDLKTFTVDIGRSIQLSRRIPAGKLLIAESGISGVQTILQMREAGFDGFLIGESFMKAEDPGAAFRQFVGELRELKR